MADQSFIGQTGLPLGLQNNNPGDIKIGDNWQGMTGDDGTFVIFQSVYWGIRALARDLTNKINEGIDTITKIVNKYAPASDSNNVPAYIAAVVADTGFGADEQLGTDTDTMLSLVRAFINHEIGDQYSDMLSDADLEAGIQMANGGVSQTLTAAAIALSNNVNNSAIVAGVFFAVTLIAALAFRKKGK